jgi:hypothetical protein
MPYFVKVVDCYDTSTVLYEGWSNAVLPSTAASLAVKNQKQSCVSKAYASLVDKDKDNWVAFHRMVVEPSRGER